MGDKVGRSPMEGSKQILGVTVQDGYNISLNGVINNKIRCTKIEGGGVTDGVKGVERDIGMPMYTSLKRGVLECAFRSKEAPRS